MSLRNITINKLNTLLNTNGIAWAREFRTHATDKCMAYSHIGMFQEVDTLRMIIGHTDNWIIRNS